jgi:hypothetical protein
MKRIMALLMSVTVAVLAAPAQASFHLFIFDQVYSNADGTVQYIVMREPTGSDGENFWRSNFLTTTGPAGTQQFQFPSDLPSSNTASRSVLIATSGFAALGLVTPDYTVPNGFIPRTGGTLVYATIYDHITIPALPSDGATAVDRNGHPVPATPKNFAGATATLTAPPPTAAAFDVNQQGLTGSWFEPATSGQGIELEIYPNLVAPGTGLVQGAWFTFDAAPAGGAERQRWYTFSGNGQSGAANIPVTIVQNVGGNFDAPPMTSATAVGSGTLAFTDCTNGSLQYAFSDGTGRTGTIPLTRITPNVTCRAGGASTANADFALSGNWFDPATSGQGFLFEVNPTVPVFFFTWYTYAAAGQAAGAAGQRWFTGQGSYAPGSRTITVALGETTGGVFDQPTNPLPATAVVGNATVTFMTCSTAQLQFNFTGGGNAGKSGTIALSRVGPVPTGCASTDLATTNDPPMTPPGYPPYGP